MVSRFFVNESYKLQAFIFLQLKTREPPIDFAEQLCVMIKEK